MRIFIRNVRGRKPTGVVGSAAVSPKHSANRYWLLFAAALFETVALAQQSLTWEQVKERFQNENPTLRAGEINISESKAAEITARLRPNPSFGISVDQIVPFSN